MTKNFTFLAFYTRTTPFYNIPFHPVPHKTVPNNALGSFNPRMSESVHSVKNPLGERSGHNHSKYYF